MDYVRHLVALGYLENSAIGIVQSRRDAPTLGIGLRPLVNCSSQTLPQEPQQPTAGAASKWVYDPVQERYRRWDGKEWVWQE